MPTPRCQLNCLVFASSWDDFSSFSLVWSAIIESFISVVSFEKLWIAMLPRFGLLILFPLWTAASGVSIVRKEWTPWQGRIEFASGLYLGTTFCGNKAQSYDYCDPLQLWSFNPEGGAKQHDSPNNQHSYFVKLSKLPRYWILWHLEVVTSPAFPRLMLVFQSYANRAIKN